jgi:phage baseplate assembly protein gpV
MVMSTHGSRRAHLGARHDGDDGVVTWFEATTAKTLELISSRTADAVVSCLDAGYVARMIRDLEAAAGVPVKDPDTTVKVVTTKLRIPESLQADLLAHFHAGGARTAGGIMHAITSLAQTLPDTDAAHELESVAVQAMRLAAATA